MLRRLQRKLFGPKFYRPPVSELAIAGGVVDRMMQRIATDVRADARPSLETALAYPPGSTFKIVCMLAGLKTGAVEADSHMPTSCSPTIRFPRSLRWRDAEEASRCG